MYMRKGQERIPIADREHRHRATPAARDDASALERVESEVELRPARPDRRTGCELPVARADHDAAVDGEVLQRARHPFERGLLRALDVGAPEPARACERRRLCRAHA
jgi:hypothetical protein